MPTDYTGQTFGRLLVIDFSHTSFRKTHWVCVCECGNLTIAMSSHLTCSRIRSCGCLKKEEMSGRFSTHRMSGSKEYVCWSGMKYRCDNEDCEYYSDYGGRGIRVCARWHSSFENFLEDMGPMPVGMNSVDRIDVNGDYGPNNCRWGNAEIQSRNKRNNVWIEYNGLRLVAMDWAIYLGVNQANLYTMLKNRPFEEIYEFYLKKYGSLPYAGPTKEPRRQKLKTIQ